MLPDELSRAEGMLRDLSENATKVESLYNVLHELGLQSASDILESEGTYIIIKREQKSL